MMLQQKVAVISLGAHADLRNVSDEGWNESAVELYPHASLVVSPEGLMVPSRPVKRPSNSRPQKEVPRILPAPRAVIAEEAPRGD